MVGPSNVSGGCEKGENDVVVIDLSGKVWYNDGIFAECLLGGGEVALNNQFFSDLE